MAYSSEVNNINIHIIYPWIIYKDVYYDKFKQIEHTLKIQGDDEE